MSPDDIPANHPTCKDAILMHDETISLQDRSLDEIEAVLAQGADDITYEQWLAVQDFVESIGGLDNALLAVEALRRLEKAA
jgi:hypothetical protein